MGFLCKERSSQSMTMRNAWMKLEVMEEGYLDLGLALFRVRFEIIESNNDLCIIKSTIEYDVKEEAVANTSYVTTGLVAKIA